MVKVDGRLILILSALGFAILLMTTGRRYYFKAPLYFVRAPLMERVIREVASATPSPQAST